MLKVGRPATVTVAISFISPCMRTCLSANKQPVIERRETVEAISEKPNALRM